MSVYFFPNAIPGVKVSVKVNDQIINPLDGFIGVLTAGTKITIIVTVDTENKHSCFTIDPHMVKTAKATTEQGVYKKNLTVMEKITGKDKDKKITTQVAGWPSNMLCLEIYGHTWNIGIISQNGRYFLVTEKYTPAIEVNDLVPTGMVIASSTLRGLATINVDRGIFNARLHWSNMPWRKHLGLRHVAQGEVISFTPKDIISVDASSTFRKEIIRCRLT